MLLLYISYYVIISTSATFVLKAGCGKRIKLLRHWYGFTDWSADIACIAIKGPWLFHGQKERLQNKIREWVCCACYSLFFLLFIMIILSIAVLSHYSRRGIPLCFHATLHHMRVWI